MLINAANLGELFRGFKTNFLEGSGMVTPEWQKIATLVTERALEVKYSWLAALPGLRQWIGERHVKSLALHDYTVKNVPFEMTIAVMREHIEFDRYGQFAPAMREMGYEAAIHPDRLVFDLLAAGFASECYDEQYFFDADHPVGNGVVSNMQAGAGAPWFLLDTTRPVKPFLFQKARDYDFQSMTSPTDERVFMSREFRYGVDAFVNAGYGLWQLAFGSKAALSTANFDAAMAAMMAQKNDEGRPIGVRPNLLVVGPSNRAAALEAVKVARQAGGADNKNFNAVDVLVTPYLT